jgi:hypothetical protein
MWKIPRLWEDGRCIIIGGGASLPKQFNVPEPVFQSVFSGKSSPAVFSPYMESIHSYHIIAVNMAYKLGDWVDCVFFGDANFPEKVTPDFFEFKGLKITCATELEKEAGYKVIPRDSDHRYGITFKPNCVSWNGNSGAAAINLAVHFGVTQILLLGFDMKLDEGGNQHWHKFYKTNLNTVEGKFKIHSKGFPHIVEDLHGRVEIINCNPNSAITDFPRCNIKDIIK